ncbi:hypothetical protein SAMN05216464_110255 [Mucilaginibacter pineti]|uniref:Uncharacterized protein n=1 Tax=Mucilaginibacter pineti TaxID=1391627 RepID=A0A1G7GQY2_9SPHI|nr:hypothetical protein [Mucilaginibacter pineti]SDE90526.1 hypothetical protein SAMN05216464_110255 [Mucilaginibacter pineti]
MKYTAPTLTQKVAFVVINYYTYITTMQILQIGKAMWSYDYEIAALTLVDEAGALFSLTPPPHHREGEILLTNASLVIDGYNYLNIPLNSLEQVYLGFDEIYKRSLVKNNGMFWQPLRLRYKVGNDTHIVYIIVDHTFWGTKNQQWFNTLKQMLADKEEL